jgi:hypothetical protein
MDLSVFTLQHSLKKSSSKESGTITVSEGRFASRIGPSFDIFNCCSVDKSFGGDLASTPVAKPEVHVERVVTLVKQLL